MSVSLAKGQNVSLTKDGITDVVVGLGWDVKTGDGKDFDLDASCFLLTKDRKVRGREDFIFYNNKKSSCGCVEHMGDNRTGEGAGDDEQIAVHLAKLDPQVDRVAVVVSIYEAKERNQNFGQVNNAYIRVINTANNEEVARFDLTEDASTAQAMVLGELYRHGNDWKFKACGTFFKDGLAEIADLFGA